MQCSSKYYTGCFKMRWKQILRIGRDIKNNFSNKKQDQESIYSIQNTVFVTPFHTQIFISIFDNNKTI